MVVFNSRRSNKIEKTRVDFETMVNLIISLLLLFSGTIQAETQVKPKQCKQYKQAFEKDRDSGMVKVYEAGARD